MKITLIAFAFAILLFSCENTANKNELKNNEPITETKKPEASEKKDLQNNCNEFINQYEKWATNYIDLIEKFMKTPTDPNLTQEYQEAAQDAMEWSLQWNQKFMHCATDEANAVRFEEISKKLETRLEKMGIKTE